MASFIYIILGSCENITIGPTAIMATMVQPLVAKYGSDIAILIAFLKGCIIALLGIFQLGMFFLYTYFFLCFKVKHVINISQFKNFTIAKYCCCINAFLLFFPRLFIGLHIASRNYWLYISRGNQHSVFPI